MDLIEKKIINFYIHMYHYAPSGVGKIGFDILSSKPGILVSFIAAGPALFRLHPQKGLTICICLTYQALKSREGIIFRKILSE